MLKQTMMTAAGLAFLAGAPLWAGQVLKLDDDGKRTFEVGADEQFRMERYSRNVYLGPDHLAADDGPAYEYLRMRDRVWGKLTLSPDVVVFGRLAHRWQYFSSRAGNNNIRNQNSARTTTWRFPEEVVVDNLYLNLDKIAGSNWSLRLGRFDLTEGPKSDPVFGNGMILRDGTPRDGGRTNYFDGALATWKGKKDTVRLTGLHSSYKDEFPVINDQSRALNRGGAWLAGGSWTHEFAKSFKTELYYFHADINDKAGEAENARLEVPGIRVFGDLHPQVSYSLEYAREFGHYQGGTAGGAMQDAAGEMVDARLNLKAPEGTLFAPVFKLEYTQFSGNDKGTAGRYEGWHPLFADNAVLFREECYYVINKGNWTNLHQYRLACELTLRGGDAKNGDAGKVMLTPTWSSLYADRQENGTGGGGHIGELPAVYLDWQVKAWWKVSVSAAGFLPGGYYGDGHPGEWLRLEMTFTF